MITKQEIQEWLDTLPADDTVGIDEGGLTLVSSSGAYLEVGGEPDEDDEES